MVALISGPLGIAQQIILLVSSNPDPIWQAKLLGVIAWTSFFIAAVWLWALEHRKVSQLEIKLTDALSQNRPKVVGAIGKHILTYWLQDENEDYRGRPREDNILGVRVWLDLLISNESQVPTSILRFSLEMQVSEQSYVADRPAFHPPPSTFEVWVAGDDMDAPAPGFGENLATVFKDGKKVKPYKPYQGHLVFDVPGVDFEACQTRLKYVITATDPTGGKHPIVAMGHF